MKKSLIAFAISALVAVAGTGTAVSQEAVVYVPVDIIACKYNEGRGPSDLDAAVEKYNAYADGTGRDNYAAWTMTKEYATPDQDFDFAWLGAHKSGETMGVGRDAWKANGAEAMAAFAAVATCEAASNYASRMFKAPPDGNIPGDGVLEFTNCELEEEASYEDVVAATNEWLGVMAEAGSSAAHYHWYPIYGSNEEDLDWKWITAYENYTELGKDYDRIGNGGLFRKQRELLGELMDCNVARVYDVKLRRAGKIRE